MASVAMDVATDPVQVESPSSITTAASWASLPVELRQMILSQVDCPISGKRCKGLGSLKLAPFATVCREWQVFFEAYTFRRLVLDPDSLSEFGAVIRRHGTRLGYIRKLWLRVLLPKYECPDCDEPEDEATQQRNDTIFTTCIQSLLETLQLWDPARHGPEGLALMLSASSPSDTEHRYYRCEIKDDYPFHYAEDLDLAPGIVEFHGMKIVAQLSRLFHRGCLAPLHNGHLKRLQGIPLRLQSQRTERGRFVSQHKSLPAVPMVKGLVMRRQFHRDIHIGTLSRLLGRSFVALEWFRFERTASLDLREQISFDKGFQLHLLPSLPKTLRQFSFTQWEVPRIELLDDLEQVGSEIPPHAQTYLPRDMAELSQRLERFCPPWQMDTAAFLRCVIELGQTPDMRESALKRMILHCSLSSSERSRQDFESLVTLAAKAALSLPRLEVIELWATCLAGRDISAYIFQYSCEDGRARIVWKSSEDIPVAPARIIARWSEVAQKHSHSPLADSAVRISETKSDIFWSNGACIYRHLLLRDLAFDPITQIILENEPFRWAKDEWSDSWHHGHDLISNLASTDLLGNNSLMDIFGTHTDPASIQADMMALEAEMDVFFQRHHG